MRNKSAKPPRIVGVWLGGLGPDSDLPPPGFVRHDPEASERFGRDLEHAVKNVRDDKDRRARGRQAQAQERKDENIAAFEAKVWPYLSRVYVRGSKWREEARRLCRAAGLAEFSEGRQLERLIQEARNRGVPIPWLNKPRAIPDKT